MPRNANEFIFTILKELVIFYMIIVYLVEIPLILGAINVQLKYFFKVGEFSI